MPGLTKGHKQGDWDESSMKNAVFAVMLNGMSKKKAAKIHNVSRQTLQRHINKAKLGLGVEKRLGRRATLTDELEQELSEKLQSMEGQLHGLTPMDVRRVVFDFCKTNNVENCFNTNKEIAGRKWFKLFMKRHKELSIRSPEPTSIQRAQGFNKPKVMQFYAILKTLCLLKMVHEEFHRKTSTMPMKLASASVTNLKRCWQSAGNGMSEQLPALKEVAILLFFAAFQPWDITFHLSSYFLACT